VLQCAAALNVMVCTKIATTVLKIPTDPRVGATRRSPDGSSFGNRIVLMVDVSALPSSSVEVELKVEIKTGVTFGGWVARANSVSYVMVELKSPEIVVNPSHNLVTRSYVWTSIDATA
jgi:hypothetical protein